MFRLLAFVPLILLLAGWISLGDSPERTVSYGAEPLLLVGHAYRALLPVGLYDLTQIISKSQQAGLWVRIYDGKGLSYFQGTTPCTTCDPSQDKEFLAHVPALYVDNGLFLLRLSSERYKYTLRPSPTDAGRYEITIQPASNLGGFTVATEILQKLLDLGVIATASVDLTLEEITVLPGTKLPKVPEGIKLDSVLYGLSLMPDWYEFAATQQLEMWGLRVRVLIELTSPDAPLMPSSNLIVEARSSSGLVRALIPVHALSEVSRDPAIKIIRPPAVPKG